MRVLVFGNSGSGKSTLARHLARRHDLPLLDLDSIVWEPCQIALQRDIEAILNSLMDFIDQHTCWVIEGCYGELVQLASAYCDEMLFLNPGLDACLENNRARPWEPHKYKSKAEQDAMLENLQAWVTSYYTREDQWSYAAHRKVFYSYDGSKQEYRHSPALEY